MNRYKRLIILNIAFLVFLFFFLVYPGLDVISNVSDPFSLLLRAMIFIGVTCFIFFSSMEIRHWYLLYEDLHEKDRIRTEQAEKQDIKQVLPTLHVDPEKNYQDITANILKLMLSHLAGETAYLYFFNHENNQYILQDYVSNFDVNLNETIDGSGELFGNFNESEKPKVFNINTTIKEALDHYQALPKVGTVMLVPVYLGGFIGFIGIDSVAKNAWSDEDAELAGEYSKLYTSNIWQVDSLQKQEDSVRFFRELNRLHSEMSLGITDYDLYNHVRGIIKQFFPYTKLSLIINKNQNSPEFNVEFIDGYEADFSVGTHLKADGGLLQKVSDKSILNVAHYDKSNLDYRFFPTDFNNVLNSCLAMKFEFGHNNQGFVVLEHSEPGIYSEHDENTLQILVATLKQIMSHVCTFRSMKDMAMLDSLTSIFNRRAFEERLQIEIERSRRYSTNLTLLMLDLDKFKRINDQYGHLSGDYVLRKTAQIIKSSIRTIDTLARIGGEEFAVILINTDKNQCLNTAERIRTNFEDFLFKYDNMDEKITISIGMSDFPTDADSMQTLVSFADQALYASKRAGGNKVTMYKQ